MSEQEFSPEDILVVRDLRMHFRHATGAGRGSKGSLRAVDGVSFRLRRGETLGLVGESGCGKSTLSRTILRVHAPTGGEVWLNTASEGPPQWLNLARLSGRALRPLRKHLQMVFQDPFASLNPRMSVGRIVAEPMEIHRLGSRSEIRERTAALLEEVGLDVAHQRRFPHEFSGGQRQRIGIARALSLNPRVLVCDEPVSALDVSVRSQILNLFLELQERRGLAYLFIAHDLSVVKRVSHRVAVMYLGKIVEAAPSDRIYSSPRHPYTRALLSAIPIPDPVVEERREPQQLLGEVPSPTTVYKGCPFVGRCPERMESCEGTAPVLGPPEDLHQVACHLEG